jgi:hypothetical protein
VWCIRGGSRRCPKGAGREDDHSRWPSPPLRRYRAPEAVSCRDSFFLSGVYRCTVNRTLVSPDVRLMAMSAKLALPNPAPAMRKQCIAQALEPGRSLRVAYLRVAQAYMLISMPTDTSTIFGVFQVIDLPPRLRISPFEIGLRGDVGLLLWPRCDAMGITCSSASSEAKGCRRQASIDRARRSNRSTTA